MQYLDSKIVRFINFFYDEVKKNKMPWVVRITLFDPVSITMGGLKVDIRRTDIDLNYTKYFVREQITLPKASPEDLAKCVFEEIRKEFDHWNSENH